MNTVISRMLSLRTFMRCAGVLCLSVLLASCQTPGPALPSLQGESPQPRVALVLGGGAARGFAHIGVIRALEREKIPIDLIVGTSVGSLIGAIYAADRNSFDLEWTAFLLEKESIFDFGFITAITGMGAAKGEKLEEFVRTKIPITNIEDLKIPFVAVATDLNKGTRVLIEKGPVDRAVRASSAIPGVFPPVDHQGKMLVDGGVVDNVPVEVAREKGVDLVIAVDIGQQVVNYNINNLLDVMLQSITIMAAENSKFKKKGADILVAPKIGDVGMLDFSQKKRCMQAGIDATEAMMPEIKRKIEEWQRNRLVRK